MLVHVLILNYNGQSLLAECLPSVLRAASASRHRCDVAVIDNDSSDDSVEWLGADFPSVQVLRRPNRGLCSYNDVVGSLAGRIAVLLNNDVKLAEDCIDPLVAPLLDEHSDCFMTAPRCYRFDQETYEGFRTAVLWRWGLIQATALFPGHHRTVHEPGPTASAGAAMAVDCRKFVELGGFDPLYLPGRLEDLDLAFRAFLDGYCACYVPEALAWHQGMATFGPRFGTEGCDELALRNTLLFEWKNLRHPADIARALAGLVVRWGLEVATAPWLAPERRWRLSGAAAAAVRRWRCGQDARDRNGRPSGQLRREREFFERFSPERMAPLPASSAAGGSRRSSDAQAGARRSMTRHPMAGPNYRETSTEVCRSR
jgi:N-acetylglucosaminyl-diphospho-decaprenol L-rhamnosyltransferase